MSIKCSGSGTADTCLTGSDASSSGNTTPFCGTTTQGTIGVCGPCEKDGGGTGDAMSKGTCTDADALNVCTASGECKCQKDLTGGGDGDGLSKGTCTDADMRCQSDGTCKCQKTSGSAPLGDGSTPGSCTGTGECCCSTGECKVGTCAAGFC